MTALAACLTAALAICRRVIRPAAAATRTARVQQQRDQRIADTRTRLGHWHIDDGELADHLAMWTHEQAGLDRLRDEIKKQQREEEA